MKKFLKGLLVAFLLCVSQLGFAQAVSGTLYRSVLSGYDFNYIPSKSYSYNHLINGGTLTAQAQFLWQGSGTVTEGHAILAFTQRQVSTGWFNTAGDELFTHGMGAFVGVNGLELEIWMRQNGAANAITWSQYAGGCARDVQGTIPPGTMCLPNYVNSGSYLTSYPGFTLKRNVVYTLKVKLEPASAGWTNITAELYERVSGVDVLRQKGRIGVQTASYFPVVNQDAAFTVARTPCDVQDLTINYIANN